MVRPAKLELEGDLGLLGDLDIFEELGDLGNEFLGDLDDLDFDLEWPGIIEGYIKITIRVQITRLLTLVHIVDYSFANL